MKNHIRTIFNAIIDEAASSNDALDFLKDLLKKIQSGKVSYINLSPNDHQILVTNIEKEVNLLLSGEKIQTGFRFDRKTLYHLIHLTNQSGLGDRTKALELILLKTKSININVE